MALELWEQDSEKIKTLLLDLDHEELKAQLHPLNQEATLPFLWVKCRPVSEASKEAVERIFIEHHLKKTFFQLDFEDEEDRQASRSGGGSHCQVCPRQAVSADFEYNRLSDDGTLAIFKLEKLPNILLAPTIDKVREYIDSMNLETTKHHVQIRRMVNDSPLPDASFNRRKRELTIDWRKLYDAFFWRGIYFLCVGEKAR